MTQIHDLRMLIIKLYLYEPAILYIIKYYMNTITFKTKEELKNAVILWCGNNKIALANYGHISDWDVSKITDMSGLFRFKRNFDDDISRWNVSAVTDMSYMFWEAQHFNCNVNHWDVHNVVNMKWMFAHCYSFSQYIHKWNVSNVRNMTGMFYDAPIFKKEKLYSIQQWNVNNIIKNQIFTRPTDYYLNDFTHF